MRIFTKYKIIVCSSARLLAKCIIGESMYFSRSVQFVINSDHQSLAGCCISIGVVVVVVVVVANLV